MSSRERTSIAVVLLVGVLAVGVALWSRGPSEETVRQTVLTTIEEESPASFLVTGTLTMNVAVRIDSSQYLTPNWLTFVLEHTQPSVLPLLHGTARTQVRVPGRVSYGFDVRSLNSSMITVEDDRTVAVDLPELSVYSVEPNLGRMEVKTGSKGWMRVLPSRAHEDVRKKALSAVEPAFRAQAERRLETGTQPRVNTARALEAMLAPPLEAAGLDDPQFRIRVGERLVRLPSD